MATSDETSTIFELKEQLALACQIIALYGADELLFGHCSVRLPNVSERFLINGFGRSFKMMRAADIVEIDSEGHSLDPTQKPSSFRLHKHFHKASSENNVILHSHAPAVIAYANTGHKHNLSHYEAMMGECCFLTSPNSGFHPECFAEMADLSKGCQVIFCEQHGVFVIGQNIKEAVLRFYFVIRASQVFGWTRDEKTKNQPAPISFPDPATIEHAWQVLVEELHEAKITGGSPGRSGRGQFD